MRHGRYAECGHEVKSYLVALMFFTRRAAAMAFAQPPNRLHTQLTLILPRFLYSEEFGKRPSFFATFDDAHQSLEAFLG